MADLPLSPDNYKNYDTLEDALEALTRDMVEPWPWNQWQRMCAVLRPEYGEFGRPDNR